MAAITPRSYGFDDVPKTYEIRIPETAFIASIATFLTLAIISAVVRTVLRIYHYKTVGIDDCILIFACCLLGAAAGTAWTIKHLIYLQIYVGLGWQDVDETFFPRMLDFERRIIACSVLVWTAIYAVKLSFLIFFKRLVNRVRSLEIQLWVCLGFVAVGAGISIPLAFIICPHLDDDYMTYCPIKTQIYHEVIYLQTTVAVDVFTDVLLVSIPVRLLWNLQMPLKKKFMLGCILSLSAVMIVIAIVRTTLAPLPNGVIDTSWLVFWQGMEAAVAVIMVSLTAFRGLFSGEPGSRRSKGNRFAAEKPSDGSDSTPAASGGSKPKSSKKVRSLYDEENIRLTGVDAVGSPRRGAWDIERD